MAWSLRKALGRTLPPLSSAPRSDELFKGAPKPSLILVDMAIQKLQQNYVGVKSQYGDEWSWTHDQIKLTWRRRTSDIRDVSLHLKDKLFTTSNEEIKKLTAAINGAMQWKVEYDKNKQESDRQQRAVDAIEEFFAPKGGCCEDVGGPSECPGITVCPDTVKKATKTFSGIVEPSPFDVI